MLDLVVLSYQLRWPMHLLQQHALHRSWNYIATAQSSTWVYTLLKTSSHLWLWTQLVSWIISYHFFLKAHQKIYVPSQFEKLLTLICLRLSYLGWWRLHWKDLSHISVCASTYTDHPHHRESDGPVCTSVWCHELLAEKCGKKAFRFASNRSTLISSGSNGPKIKKAQTYSFFFTLSGLGVLFLCDNTE